MTQIFISYRRADSHAITDRIQDRLESVYGKENVFQDVEDIPPGANFKEYLDIQVSLCDVLLVIIGPEWLDIRDENGRRRLDNPSDFVRIEVESGLKRKEILVVPVLVQGAAMPQESDLPPSIRDLHYRNAIRVRNNPDFDRDIQSLISSINQYVRNSQPKKPGDKPRRSPLPLILGGIATLAVLAVIAAQFILPTLQPTPVPTATPNITETQQAVAALQTATAQAQPTNTPEPEPTATPAPASPTPSPSPTEELTSAATATVLYPEGRLLEMYYNASGFYLKNASSSRVPLGLLRFRAINEDNNLTRFQYFGGTWSQSVPQLNAGSCARLEMLQQDSFERPGECTSYAVLYQPARGNDTVFWIPRNAVNQFVVYWDNQEVGRCEITAGQCAVYVPR